MLVLAELERLDGQCRLAIEKRETCAKEVDGRIDVLVQEFAVLSTHRSP